MRLVLDGMPRKSRKGRRTPSTWSTPSLACANSRGLWLRLAGSAGSTGDTSARRGRSAGKRYLVRLQPRRKPKIPETNSNYNHKEILPRIQSASACAGGGRAGHSQCQTTPTLSATQSLRSALRLKLGWISSMAPPKALAPMKTAAARSGPCAPAGRRVRRRRRSARACRCPPAPGAAPPGARASRRSG